MQRPRSRNKHLDQEIFSQRKAIFFRVLLEFSLDQNPEFTPAHRLLLYCQWCPVAEAQSTQDVGCDAQCNASKWDLLMRMGVSTLHASNIKGKMFEFARGWRPASCVDWASGRKEDKALVSVTTALSPALNAGHKPSQQRGSLMGDSHNLTPSTSACMRRNLRTAGPQNVFSESRSFQ